MATTLCAVAATLLAATLISCGGSKLPDLPTPPPVDESDWPSAGTDPTLESGMYVGIVGFNKSLQVLSPRRLPPRSSGSTFKSFINNLTWQDDTGLYYAVDEAVDLLQTTAFPTDVENVVILTITDGLDNYSIELDTQYRTVEAYRKAVRDHLHGATFMGLPVVAHSRWIRSKGAQTVSEDTITAILNDLRNSNGTMAVVEDTKDLEKQFEEIAEGLYKQSRYTSTRIRIAGGRNSGTRMRFTFDNQTANANASAMYIEGTYIRNGDSRSLQNIVYKGLRSSSGSTVTGSLNEGEVTFAFNNLVTDYGIDVNVSAVNQWIGTSSSSWEYEVEFKSANSVSTVEDNKSAVVMLVLDCTTSLETEAFENLKKAAVSFIDVLSGINSTSGNQPTGDGVYINGTTWATRNVGTSGTFATSPDDYGGYFTFNQAQAACPAGWRMPTRDEMASLINAGYEWRTVYGVHGYRFGNSDDSSIFLPATGYSSSSDGSINARGLYGYYWSSNMYNSTNAYHLLFYNTYVSPSNVSNYANGLSVRCVRR